MATPSDLNTLDLSAEEMRQLGYRVVDMIVDHHQQLADKSATTHADRATLRERLHEPAPEQPSDPRAVLDAVERDVLSCVTHANHPRFFAYIPGPSNFVGAMGDALASGFNVINTLWLEASAPAQVELTVIDWIKQWCGLPEGAGGLFVSGGSVANLTGLAVARQVKLENKVIDAVTYGSDQTHGSLEKNLKLLGFEREQFVKIPTDDRFRIDVNSLDERIKRDLAAGRRPFCVIANAGTTNTGAVDSLDQLRSLCNRYDLWLHVDGAYGVPAILTDRGRREMRGLESADSITVDPHKWLFQPFEIGCALVRDARWLPLTFGQQHEYMQDAFVDAGQDEVNFCDYGIQLSRGFRALKLWMTIKTFGLAAIRSAIKQGIEHAEVAQTLLETYPCFGITSPAQLGVISFRYVTSEGSDDEHDAVNLAIVSAMMDDGFCMISSTQLRGHTCLRMCTINPRTTRKDIMQTIELIAKKGKELSAISC